MSKADATLPLLDEIPTLLRENRPADAEAICRQRLESAPDDAPAWFALATVAQHRGDWPAVAEHAETAIKLAPTLSGYHLLAGVARFMVGQYANSIPALEKAVSLDSQNALALNNLAVAYSRIGKNRDAESLLRRALQVDSGNPETWMNLCSAVAEQSGREAEVVSIAREAVRRQPRSPKPYTYLGQALLRNGEPEAAIRTYSIALTLGGDEADLRFRIAMGYQLLDRIPEALEEFQRSIALNPKNGYVYAVLATLLVHLGPAKYAAAEKACRLAIECPPIEGDPIDHLARSHHLLAEIQALNGDMASSLNSFRESRSVLTSNNRRALNDDFQNEIRLLPTYRADRWMTEAGFPFRIVLDEKTWLSKPLVRFGLPAMDTPEPVLVPAAYVGEIPDATIVPGHEPILVENEGKILFDRLVDLKNDFNYYGDLAVPIANRQSAIASLPPKANEIIPVGIFMLGHYWFNYAHWLTEHLTRLCVLDQFCQYDGWPILANDGLYPQQREAIELLVGKRYPIRYLPRNQRFHIERLIYPSNLTASLTMRSHIGSKTSPIDGAFHPEGIEYLRSRLLPHTKYPKKVSRRLWVSRTHRQGLGQRRLINEAQIEAEFAAKGFERVLPETMSFLQQVELFSQAELIAGPSGAGLANMIFAPPEAKILVFIKDHVSTPYYYFSNLAQSCGQQLTYVCGTPKPNLDIDIVHADFEVPVPRAIAALKSVTGGN